MVLPTIFFNKKYINCYSYVFENLIERWNMKIWKTRLKKIMRRKCGLCLCCVFVALELCCCWCCCCCCCCYCCCCRSSIDFLYLAICSWHTIRAGIPSSFTFTKTPMRVAEGCHLAFIETLYPKIKSFGKFWNLNSGNKYLAKGLG